MDYVALDTLARKAEKVSNWSEAARLWSLAGNNSEAETCRMIADANAYGDRLRAYIEEHAGVEPEVSGVKEDSIKWMAWYRRMEKAVREFEANNPRL